MNESKGDLFFLGLWFPSVMAGQCSRSWWATERSRVLLAPSFLPSSVQIFTFRPHLPPQFILSGNILIITPRNVPLKPAKWTMQINPQRWSCRGDLNPGKVARRLPDEYPGSAEIAQPLRALALPEGPGSVSMPTWWFVSFSNVKFRGPDALF